MVDRDPLFINASAGAPAYDAGELRRAFGLYLTKGVTHRFGARSGVHPAGSDAVSLAGTTWTVLDLNAVVYPGLNSQDGAFVAQIPSETGSLNAPDGTNPRIDAIDLQVQDNDTDSSGQRRARLIYVAGTPAPSPAAPSVSATSMRLCTFLVPKSGGGAASVTYSAPYTVASGGILPVRTAAELPTAGLYEGMYADQWDTNSLLRWNGTAWDVVATPPTGFTTYTPTVTGQGTATFSQLTGVWKYLSAKVVWCQIAFTVSAVGSGASNVTISAPTNIERTLRNVMSGHLEGMASPSLRNTQLIALASGSGNVFDRIRSEATTGSANVTGADLASGAIGIFEGTYREA